MRQCDVMLSDSDIFIFLSRRSLTKFIFVTYISRFPSKSLLVTFPDNRKEYSTALECRKVVRCEYYSQIADSVPTLRSASTALS